MSALFNLQTWSRGLKRAANGVSRLISTLWQARRSPSRGVRVGWWLSVVIVLLMLLAGSRRESLYWVLIGTANVAVVGVCGTWSLFHPRIVMQARRVIMGFGLLTAFLSILFLFALQDALTGIFPELSFSPSALFLYSLIVCPFSLLVCFLFGYLAAGIGAFCGRRSADSSHFARYGAYGWWLAMWLGGALLSQAERLTLFEAPTAITVWFCAPLFAAAAALISPHVRINDIGLLRRIVAVLDRRFRIRVPWRTRPVDLRGLFLGGIAGMVVLIGGLGGLLYPLQTRLLAALIQFRSASVVPAGQGVSIGRLLDEGRSRRQTRSIVLLRMDSATRHSILESGSEPEVQARLIRTLSQYGCRCLVLPAPLYSDTWERSWAATPETPVADAAVIERARRDARILEAAVKQAGNVIVALPNTRANGFGDVPDRKVKEDREQVAHLSDLARAARTAGRGELDNLTYARLPAMTFRWDSLLPDTDNHDELPPLPVVLYALLRGDPLPARVDLFLAQRVRFGKESLPLTAPGQIVVSYFAGEPEAAFPEIGYSTVLAKEQLASDNAPHPLLQLNEGRNENRSPDASSVGKIVWRKPEDYFRGKIVFLDRLDLGMRATPIGNMTEPELMAHASTTLLTHSIVRKLLPLPTEQVLLTTLLIAALIGSATLRKPPLQAGVYALLIELVFIAASLTAFLFGRFWIDILIPALGGITSYLMVVQFSYAVDKWDLSRNRGVLERFLDREIVDQLLASGDDLKLGGERKYICVLFADIRGFSRYAQDNPPEEVVQTVNEYLGAMADEVRAQKGLLDKFLGDGMLALFGIPKEQENDAERAVRCALGMQAAAARISEGLRGAGKQSLALGVSLHCGEAIFGMVGSLNRSEMTAIGKNVVVGQRLQTTAQGGEIIVSDRFYEHVKDVVVAEEREPVTVKGFIEPMRSYRLLRLKDTGEPIPPVQDARASAAVGSPALAPPPIEAEAAPKSG